MARFNRYARFGGHNLQAVLGAAWCALACASHDDSRGGAPGTDQPAQSMIDCSKLPTIPEPYNRVNDCPKDADGNPIAGKLCGDIISCYLGFCPDGVVISEKDAAAYRACYCAGPALVSLLDRCGG